MSDTSQHPPHAPNRPKVTMGVPHHEIEALRLAAQQHSAQSMPVITAQDIRNQALLGADGGNVPLDGAASPDARRLGDVTIRTLNPASGRMEVTDRLGRTLTVQRLTELERFDLYEAFGSSLPNAYTAAMAALAATLRSVRNPDGTGTGRAFPRNMAHIRGALTVLGEAGMDALRTAFAPEEPKAAEDAGEAPDANGVAPDGSVPLAKN